ncbi:hypothetical protein COOONC_25791 [Cooperia oncophora]
MKLRIFFSFFRLDGSFFTLFQDKECYIIHSVYVRLLRRLKYCFKPIADLALTLISEKGIPLSREALLVKMLNDIYDDLTNDHKDDTNQKIERYLGDDVLSPVRRTVVDSCHGEDVNKLASKLHEYRLRLSIRVGLPSLFRKSANDVVKECVSWLECASAYPVAECYLDIADVVIEQVSCPETLLALLEAAFSVMNEERKSQHFLPALRRTLSLCLKNFAVAQSDVTQLLLSRCTELLELAQLNTPVALLLSQCLLDSCRANSQGEAWASIVFDLAVFGPIPKKEHKVLNAAYDMIYEERVNNFDDVHRPFEVLQRTRLNGICLALRLARIALCSRNILLSTLLLRPTL